MAQISVEQLEKEYECEYCHDPFRDPRALPCLHTYCRSCLDEMVEFNDGGAATIACPNRCPQVNNIGKDETTQIFPRNFVLSKIMAKINESKNSKKKCEASNAECKSEISKWCVGCKKTFCNGCFHNHECLKKFGVYGKFNEYSETFEAYCEEHDACAKYVCFDCNNQFLCSYCFHRKHVYHASADLRKAASQMKEDCTRDLENAEDLFRKTSFITYEKALYDIDEFKNNLNYELNKRIVLKLESLKGHLEKEKARIMNKFQIETDKYKQQLDAQGLSNRPIFKVIKERREAFEKKTDYEMIIEEKQSNVLNKFQQLNVQFTEKTKYDYLGVLRVTHSNTSVCKLSDNKKLEAFRSNIKSEMQDAVTAKGDSLHLFLKDILKEIQENADNAKQQELAKKNALKDSLVLVKNEKIKEFKKIVINNSTNKFNALRPAAGSFNQLLSDIVKENKPNILKMLFDYVPPSVWVDKYKHASLRIAAEQDYKEIVELLLQNGADPNNKNIVGQTCLHLASANCHHDVLAILIESGADLNAKDESGETCLLKAAKYGYQNKLEYLKYNSSRSHKTSLAAVYRAAMQSIYRAAKKDYHDVIKLLLENGADPNVRHRNGDTILHDITSCSGAGDDDIDNIVRTVLKYNVDVNITNERGQTPLMIATQKNKQSTVGLLLDLTNLNIKDADGKTVFDYPQNDEMRKILKHYPRYKVVGGVFPRGKGAIFKQEV